MAADSPAKDQAADDELSVFRRNLSPEQRAVLTKIWREFVQRATWPPSKVIHHTLGKPEVRATIASLPQGLVHDLTDSRKYSLSFLGALLTDDAPKIERVLQLYLQYIRDRFLESPDYSEVTNAELEQSCGLTREETTLLHRAIEVSGLRSGGGHDAAGEKWHARIPDEIDDLPQVIDTVAFLHQRAMTQRRANLERSSAAQPSDPSAPDGTRTTAMRMPKQLDLLARGLQGPRLPARCPHRPARGRHHVPDSARPSAHRQGSLGDREDANISTVSTPDPGNNSVRATEGASRVRHALSDRHGARKHPVGTCSQCDRRVRRVIGRNARDHAVNCSS
jgi:hypothetical protein